MAYQEKKTNKKTIPPLELRSAADSLPSTSARSAPRRAAAVVALEAISRELPPQEVQTTKVHERTHMSPISVVVTHDECKLGTQNNIKRKTPQSIVAPRSHSPGEHFSQVPGCSHWSPPPVVPRTTLSENTESDTTVPELSEGTSLKEDTLSLQIRRIISTSLDSLGKDHNQLIDVAKEALKGSDGSFQAALDLYVASLFPGSSALNKKRPTVPSAALPTPRNRAQAKAAAYKKAQDLFLKAPKSLVEQILSGKLDRQDTRDVPSIEDVEKLYGNLLESTPEYALNTQLEQAPVFDINPLSGDHCSI